MQLEEKELNPEMANKFVVSVPSKEDVENWFVYHSPNLEDVVKYQRIRESALACAQTIAECCPNSADKTAAIRKLREAVMTANASIACFKK